MSALERIEIGRGDAPKLTIDRMATGLWQVADMERLAGAPLDLEKSATALVEYVDSGFRTFDMADHYGTAELITARACAMLRERGVSDGAGDDGVAVFTKWCPKPGPMNGATVRTGVLERLERLGTARLDLLQLHWWHYEHLSYVDLAREVVKLQLEGLVAHVGLTNFDTDHLRVWEAVGVDQVRAQRAAAAAAAGAAAAPPPVVASVHGGVATNQVCFSLLDRRPLAEHGMCEYCAERGIKLLCYGSLGGGFLSDAWLGEPEPAAEVVAAFSWSQAKYFRFIAGIGGWAVLQRILEATAAVAKKHGGVSIANVATRWVLEQPAVGAVIVGARIGVSEHREDNARAFSFALDDEDRATIGAALALCKTLPGDCGDEYRRAPFLTASGDLSHHIAQLPQYFQKEAVGSSDARVGSGSVWESLAGFSRAVRRGDHIFVSGTTATHGDDNICVGDPRGQATYILDKITSAISALGGARQDVVRTRIYLIKEHEWEPVCRAHGRFFGEVRPANTLVVVAALVGEGYDVEIEADAIVPPS